MNIEEIKKVANREPFRPFAIVLQSGHEIEVTTETELLFPKNRPNDVYVFANNGAGWIFEAQAVSALQD
jgi:hypothetical protein